ncbi:HD domain-containing protein [Microbispora sp. H10836]|uniref:HD domain-containing protein n=1 Tax=Microbispora sp. H10836 TaxID=2729106 RepID=UPI001472CA43|nr:HD domain-containing protein [Microbispora sp. H10836]
METTIGPLLGRLADRFDDGDLKLVERAYRRAAKHHAGHLRHSGDPYISHPIEVATLAATTKADAATVCAALLHDIVDTGYDLDVLRAEFGAEIAGLVASVMALDQGGPTPSDQRVMLLKLFDRLHNMRTIEHLPPRKQRLKSLNTLEWFVPVARRLDLEPVAVELERLAHDRLDPGRGFMAVRAASMVFPSSARDRYLQEWSVQFAEVDGRRGVYIIETLCGVPGMAVLLWRPHARVLIRKILTPAFATRGRPWLALAPFLAWVTYQMGRSSLADAFAFVLTIPPALSALIIRIRIHLGLERERDTGNG